MRVSTALLSIAALASATASAFLWTELRAERQRNAELSAHLDQAFTDPAAASVPAPVARPKVHSTTSASIAVSPSPTDQATGRAAFSQEDWMASQRRLLSDPRYREAWIEQQRLQRAGYRGKLMDLLGFSAEQADVIVDLSIERQLSWQIQTPPDPMTEDYLREQKQRADAMQRTEQAKLREVLGEAKYVRFQEYLESSGSRQQVEQLRTQLSGVDALRDDQVEPLIAAIYAEQSQMQREMLTYRDTRNLDGDSPASIQQLAEHQAEEIKARNVRIRDTASAILSSGQLEQLDIMLKRELANYEAQVRMQRIQSKLDPPQEVARQPD